jgi:hypothetical protein
VNVFALIAAAVVPSHVEIAHCFFIVQWCALQHGGRELPAVSTLAHARTMTPIRRIETARRTEVNRNIRRRKLAELMRECTQ